MCKWCLRDAFSANVCVPFSMNVCGWKNLTSLVLQMSPSVDPQAFPGVAVHGIIPVDVKFEWLNSSYHVNNDQTRQVLWGHRARRVKWIYDVWRFKGALHWCLFKSKWKACIVDKAWANPGHINHGGQKMQSSCIVGNVVFSALKASHIETKS